MAFAAQHHVPKDRATLGDRDWLPHVISKIAPLEWWSFLTSPADIRRENYLGDFRYQIEYQDTREFPRFCFSFFRPKMEALSSLRDAVNDYSGGVFWTMHDDCIAAWPGKKPDKVVSAMPVITAEYRRKLEELARNPPQADPVFVRQAMADAPKFAEYLEQRLGLKDKPALDFDPQWLTREGLAASRGQFEDFLEPGTWSVFLALRPQEYAKTSKPTSAADRSLGMGVLSDDQHTLLEELGADWEKYRREDSDNPVLPAYPLLSRLEDLADDTIYEPDEVETLLAECLRAQDKVKDPQAIRVLDNLIRIARWAQKLKVGIYFSGV
jgi:hypothetical protein